MKKNILAYTAIVLLGALIALFLEKLADKALSNTEQPVSCTVLSPVKPFNE